jgi:hypothetical protein
MSPPEPAAPYKAMLSNVRLRAAEALAEAARAGQPESASLGPVQSAKQLHLVMRALEEIAYLAGVHPQMVADHSAVLSPGSRPEPSAYDDVDRPPGIMDSLILMIDYNAPTGQPLSTDRGQRLVTESAEQLNHDLQDLGWVDSVDGNTRGATIYLVGPDRFQLWNAIEGTVSQWPLRPMTALLRAADRRLPDTLHHIGFATEVVNDLPADLMSEVLTAMPRAMWEIPTPQLRAVSFSIRRTGVTGRFIYAEPPGSDEKELVSLFETHLYADFGDRPQFQVEFEAVHLPAGQDMTLRHGEQWFYLRNELDRNLGVSDVVDV